MSNITLYDLSGSRSIRIAWLLEELDLAYTVVHADRNESGLSDDEFKKQTGTFLGKAPVLKHHNWTIQESGAIVEYLLERYDYDDRLMPKQPASQIKVREYVHAAEATLMMHALPYLFARRVVKASQPNRLPDVRNLLQDGLTAMVRKDFDWLEHELEAKGGGWLVGNDATAADIMMGFSVQCIVANQLLGTGSSVGQWTRVAEWLKLVENRGAYQKAVKATGFVLKPQI